MIINRVSIHKDIRTRHIVKIKTYYTIAIKMIRNKSNKRCKKCGGEVYNDVLKN